MKNAKLPLHSSNVAPMVSEDPARMLWLFGSLCLAACGDQMAGSPAESSQSADPVSVPRYSARAFYETTSYDLVPPEGRAFSSDGRLLLVSSDQTGVYNAWALPLDGTPPQPLTHSGGDAFFALSWFPDDDRILYTADNGGDELNHVFVREADGGVRDLTPGNALKASFFKWSADRASFFILSTERDQQNFDLYRYAAADYERELLYENTGYDIVDLSPDGRWLALDKPRTSADSDIYLVDIMGSTSRQLTQALNPEIDPSHLVRSEVIRYRSFDGLDIPSILYRPHGATAQRPAPALVWVHGGPGGQSRTGYSAAIQHLVNHGFAVLAANNRGSSGYGKTFFHLDDRRHGEEDLSDIVHARSYLASLDWVDGTRVGVIGGSYGGFMVAAALAFHPQAFDVGIDIFGVTNWVRTLQSIPPWWASFREALYDEMGDPATDAERHRRISPLLAALRQRIAHHQLVSESNIEQNIRIE